MKMNRETLIWIMFISCLFALIGCSKSPNDENAVLQVMLTDAPAVYDAVYIDVQDVQIHVTPAEGEEESWISMEVNKGIYNLLDFRNGIDTLLATIEVPAGQVSQMRLILGPDNQISVDNNTFDLDVPSGQQSGLKFNIHAELKAGITYTLWIDFDAARSVVQKGKGKYGLKPVIRTYTEALSGGIKGIISPSEARPYIRAISNGDTLSAYAADNGYFMFNGMHEGRWTLEFFPVEPYLSLGINSIVVENGVVTDMGSVFLKHLL